VKGPLYAFKNMRRNAPKKLVSEAVKSAEEASRDGARVPARGGHERGEIAFKSETRERGDKRSPRIIPACKGDTRRPEHGSQVGAKNRPCRENPNLLELKWPIGAVGVIGDLKNLRYSSGL
jgi:hypothetical protein